jgi:ATP-dependent Clp protease ATP-binding subunit ClpA
MSSKNMKNSSEFDAETLERMNDAKSTRWIGYPRALEALDLMDDLICHPKRHRMPNLMLVGESNNGKTMIINRFKEMNSSFTTAQGETTIPCIVVECPPTPDEGRLYNAILTELMVPHKSHDHIDKRRDQVVGVLKNIKLKILILDEVHNILSGHPTKQRQMLNTIKYLGNTLQIPIIAAGTMDALRAIATDPQLANRFDRFILDTWNLDKEYLRLLASFDKSLPLKKESKLASKDVSIEIHNMSEGIIGEVFSILSKAATEAIKSGDEVISLDSLRRLRWIKPSKRKSMR